MWKERTAVVNGKCKPEMRALSCKIIHWTVHCALVIFNCPVHVRGEELMQQIKCLDMECCSATFIARILLSVCMHSSGS